MTRSVSRLGRHARWALLFGPPLPPSRLPRTVRSGKRHKAIANEMILIAKWVRIIISSFAASASWSADLAPWQSPGLLLGLVFALFASPIIAWVQGL